MAVVVRSAFVLSLALLAGLVLWCTPLPKLQHASCLRPCHELDWPMICRIKLVLDTTTVVTRGRTMCPKNVTDCSTESCTLGGTQRSTVLTANGLLPGPIIQVCEKDILVVDVVNRVPGAALAVHWRGQSQRETPYMDGAPMITQCPINSFSTFQYKFRASEPGTHLWQVQSGNEALDTLVGALVVRQSPKKDPHYDLYDEDSQFVVISELPSDANSGSATLLINGQLSTPGTEPLPHFNITMNKKHRLRIVYSATSFSCPITLGVESHSLLVIAIDGHPIRPVEVQSVKLAPGERLDAVLTSDQSPGDYQLTVKTVPSCTRSAVSSALLTYTAIADSSTSYTRPPQQINPLKGLSTVGDSECNRGSNNGLLCLPKIESLKKLPAELTSERLDLTLYLTFDFVKPPPRLFYEDAPFVPRINNLTLSLPPFPLLSQTDEEGSETVCSAISRPAHCGHDPVCQCLHMVDIPLNAAVELVLIHQGDSGGNVFHLHGYSFHVVGAIGGVGRRGVEAVKELDRRGLLFSRNLKNPIVKDTVSVPAGGVVAVRFIADNPGYWLLRADRPSLWSRGLAVILHVGGSEDVPHVPDKFPVCGSWVGPEFFLI